MASSTGIIGFAAITSTALQQAVDEVTGSLPEVFLQCQTVAAEDTLALAERHAGPADVLLVEVASLEPSVTQRIARLAQDRGDDKVTLVSAPQLSLNDVRHLHRLGVFDVVPHPVTMPDLLATLRSALGRIVALRRQAAGLAPVIAFTRAKGGMGATTIATHAALSMAGVGRRKVEPRSVAFLDLDLQFGDAAINLDITASSAVLDLIQHPDRLDAALLRSAMTERPDGLAMLAAPRQLLPLDAMEPEFVGRMIDYARESFDVVVIDLPIAITGWTQAVFSRVNELVMVTALSVSAIRRTRRLLELLTEGGDLPMHISIALNRYTYRFGQRSVLRQSEMTLGRPFDFKISNDFDLVARSQDRGTSIFDLKPRSSLARDCHHLADICLALAHQRAADHENLVIDGLAAE